MSEDDLREKFYDLSEVAQFHLAGKLFGESAVWPYDYESQAIKQETSSRIFETIEQQAKLRTLEGQHLVDLMNDVSSIELNDDMKDNQKEQDKLKAAQDAIKFKLIEVIVSIKRYMSVILELEAAGRAIDHRDKADRVSVAEDKRTRIHNKLIQDINILNRSLVWWFGEFDSGNLNDAQYEMYEKQEEKYISHNIPRLDISLNGIIPPLVDIANRKVITKWAKKIYKDLATIKKLSGSV